MTETNGIDWVRGNTFSLDLPAHPAALMAGGAEFLTRAFRASGTLEWDNSVTRITRLVGWVLGGTGVKALLWVDYERDMPGLSRDLFVTLSRNVDDPVRDRGPHHMLPEVRLANASRSPDFPVAVSRCFYADIEQETLTGIIITERVAYGAG